MEQEQIVELCNSPAYSQLPPSQIVPDLLDQGGYLASESTFYRVLKEVGQLHHRGQSLAPRLSPTPTTHTASGPCEVWCWDITYCPSTVRGQFYYLYMFEDIYSRKIVGYEVHETESGEYAAQLPVLVKQVVRYLCNQPYIFMCDVVLLGQVKPDFFNRFPVTDRTILAAFMLNQLGGLINGFAG